MSKKEEKLCDICCIKFNKSTQKEIKCDFCNSVACLVCVKRYILDTSGDYHCMFCRNKWNRGILVEKLPQAFIKNELREREEECIVNNEKARLPEAQTIAERNIKQAKIRELQSIKSSMNVGFDSSNNYKDELINMIAKNYGIDIENLDNYAYTEEKEEKEEKRQYIRNCPNSDCRGFINDKWTCGLCSCKICKTCYEEMREDEKHVCDPNIIESNKVLMKDTKPCPKCNSMIHKLSGCFGADIEIPLWSGGFKKSQNITINDVLIGDDSTPRNVVDICKGEDDLYKINQSGGMSYVVNSKHELVLKDVYNQIIKISVSKYLALDDIVKSTLFGFDRNNEFSSITIEHLGKGKYYGWLLDGNHRFILKDLTVVKNCDQMFCTVCHTAFSWTKGTVDKGPIHNPHYYQWKTQNAKTELANNNLECDENTYPTLTNVLQASNKANSKCLKWISYFHQYFTHIEFTVRPLYQPTATRDEKMDINVDYMMGKMSKTEWKKLLYSCDKRQEMARDIIDLLDMGYTISGERFRKYIEKSKELNTKKTTEKNNDMMNYVYELSNLIDYIENEVESIKKRFMVKNVIISEPIWNDERKKELIKDIN